MLKTGDGVEVENPQGLPEDEIQQYVKYVEDKTRNGEYAPGFDKIVVILDADSNYVNVGRHYPGRAFDRIRRVTGYLTGTVDRWNDAKRAELKDRVKHI